MNRKGPGLEQVVHTHRTSCGWLTGFGELNYSPHSFIFTSISVVSRARFHLFTSCTIRIPVHTAKKSDTGPIPSVKLHCRHRRGTVQF